MYRWWTTTLTPTTMFAEDDNRGVPRTFLFLLSSSHLLLLLLRRVILQSFKSSSSTNAIGSLRANPSGERPASNVNVSLERKIDRSFVRMIEMLRGRKKDGEWWWSYAKKEGKIPRLTLDDHRSIEPSWKCPSFLDIISMRDFLCPLLLPLNSVEIVNYSRWHTGDG